MNITKDINWPQLQEYENIFGFNKLNDLWHEYLEQSLQTWSDMDVLTLEEKRLAFHSWRSSSSIFGLQIFSDHCSLIEEAIVKQHNIDKLPEMIRQSKNSFQSAIAEVNPYFKKMEV